MYTRVKRLLDIALALLMLITLSPLLLLIAAMVCLDSPGPVFFRQKRIGRGGGSFRIYKFRTMYTFAPRSIATSEVNAALCVTPLGRALRKSSIDELPQLLNVLRGDMSLIGPRPLVPEEGLIHEERARLGAYRIRPGITGWAQVNGRDCLNAETKARLDAYYADHLTLRMDIKVLLYSILCVITARGIQEGGEAIDDDMPEDDTPHLKRERPAPRPNEWYARYDIESARIYPRRPQAPGA